MMKCNISLSLIFEESIPHTMKFVKDKGDDFPKYLQVLIKKNPRKRSVIWINKTSQCSKRKKRQVSRRLREFRKRRLDNVCNNNQISHNVCIDYFTPLIS